MSDIVRLPTPAFPACIDIGDAWLVERDRLVTSATKISKISSQDEFNEAESVLAKITSTSNKAEKARMDFSKPLNDFTKDVKAMADRARMPLENEKGRIKKMMADYITLKEKEAQAELERKASIAAASSFGRAEETANFAIANEEVSRTRSSVRKVWTFEIVEPDKIPREFLMVNEPAIRDYAQKNKEMASMPGVIFKEETRVQSR